MVAIAEQGMVVNRIIAITQPAQHIIEETGIDPVKFKKGSIRKQLRSLINRFSPGGEPGSKTAYVLFDGTKKQVLEAAEKTMKGSDRKKAKNLFRSLTLIAPEADKPSDTKDPATGIRVRDIAWWEPPFPPPPYLQTD